MEKLQTLEELRTIKEVKDYFKQLGKNITEEELDTLKKSYDKVQKNNRALTIQQLSDVAGGTILCRFDCKGSRESFNEFVKNYTEALSRNTAQYRNFYIETKSGRDKHVILLAIDDAQDDIITRGFHIDLDDKENVKLSFNITNPEGAWRTMRLSPSTAHSFASSAQEALGDGCKLPDIPPMCTEENSTHCIIA